MIFAWVQKGEACKKYVETLLSSWEKKHLDKCMPMNTM